MKIWYFSWCGTNVMLVVMKEKYQQGKKFAQENNMIFYETSAKTGEGLTDLLWQIQIKSMNNKRNRIYFY